MTGSYIETRLKEGGLRLVSGSSTMLSDEFARFDAEPVTDPTLNAGWLPIASAPRSGDHILVSFVDAYTSGWGYNQSPPAVVHWFDDPEEPGFYLSNGIVQGSYNDKPLHPLRWRPLIVDQPADPMRDALTEIARLRLATDEGSLRVRADLMQKIAEDALTQGVRIGDPNSRFWRRPSDGALLPYPGNRTKAEWDRIGEASIRNSAHLEDD